MSAEAETHEAETHEGATLLAWTLKAWQTQARFRVVVAIDGYGASGKTTIAQAVAAATSASVIHTDDFMREAPPVREALAPMERYYDWSALRDQALVPALSVGSTHLPPFEAPLLVEGVSSACRTLRTHVTHAVFVQTPEPIRLARLRDRIPANEWDEDWLAAERAYFATRPPASFDLIVPGYAKPHSA